MQLDWVEEKTGKPGVARRVTVGGDWSITNHKVCDGGKWELFREVGQRKFLGEFDKLFEAKDAAQEAWVAPESPERVAQ